MFWLKETPSGNSEKLYMGGQQVSLVFCAFAKNRGTGMVMACFTPLTVSAPGIWIQAQLCTNIRPVSHQLLSFPFF